MNIGDALVIPIECKEDGGVLENEIHYALAVTLEVKQDVPIQIYDEIKAQIDVQTQVHIN